MDSIEEDIKRIAFKLRAVRQLKGLSQEKFCEIMGENSEYWGFIERGIQPISLTKLIKVCKTYNIPIESVVDLNYKKQDDTALRSDISGLLNQCSGKQLEVVKKFVEEIAMAL